MHGELPLNARAADDGRGTARGAFVVRPAGAGETATVAGLFRDYADELGIDLSFQGFAAELAGLPGAYAPPRGTLLLAMSADGSPLGCVGVRPLGEPGTCEMKRLHVRAEGRGHGVGRALAASAVEWAARAGYARMRLDTLPTMRAAQSLYAALGFEPIPAYYDTPIAGTVFLQKALRPWAPAPRPVSP